MLDVAVPQIEVGVFHAWLFRGGADGWVCFDWREAALPSWCNRKHGGRVSQRYRFESRLGEWALSSLTPSALSFVFLWHTHTHSTHQNTKTSSRDGYNWPSATNTQVFTVAKEWHPWGFFIACACYVGRGTEISAQAGVMVRDYTQQRQIEEGDSRPCVRRMVNVVLQHHVTNGNCWLIVELGTPKHKANKPGLAQSCSKISIQLSIQIPVEQRWQQELFLWIIYFEPCQVQYMAIHWTTRMKEFNFCKNLLTFKNTETHWLFVINTCHKLTGSQARLKAPTREDH